MVRLGPGSGPEGLLPDTLGGTHRFLQNLHLQKGGRLGKCLGEHFRPISWEGVFPDPLLDALEAQIGSIHTCSIASGVWYWNPFSANRFASFRLCSSKENL